MAAALLQRADPQIELRAVRARGGEEKMGDVKVSDAPISMERGSEAIVDRAAEAIPSSSIEINISLPLDRMKAHIV